MRRANGISGAPEENPNQDGPLAQPVAQRSLRWRLIHPYLTSPPSIPSTFIPNVGFDGDFVIWIERASNSMPPGVVGENIIRLHVASGILCLGKENCRLCAARLCCCCYSYNGYNDEANAG